MLTYGEEGFLALTRRAKYRAGLIMRKQIIGAVIDASPGDCKMLLLRSAEKLVWRCMLALTLISLARAKLSKRIGSKMHNSTHTRR